MAMNHLDKKIVIEIYNFLADLIVTIKEKKHPKFKRVNKNDLIFTQNISLVQALNSEPVGIVTLDNRKLTIAMDEIISPQTVKLVKGEGMPIYNKDDLIQNLLFKEKRGDLYIKFDISFPKFIDPEKKEEITRLLDN
jgi:DnaJ-class molecular chaperone